MLNGMQYMPKQILKFLVQNQLGQKLLLSVLIGTEVLRYMNSFQFFPVIVLF